MSDNIDSRRGYCDSSTVPVLVEGGGQITPFCIRPAGHYGKHSDEFGCSWGSQRELEEQMLILRGKLAAVRS
jgi:hypothetical protein